MNKTAYLSGYIAGQLANRPGGLTMADLRDAMHRRKPEMPKQALYDTEGAYDNRPLASSIKMDPDAGQAAYEDNGQPTYQGGESDPKRQSSTVAEDMRFTHPQASQPIENISKGGSEKLIGGKADGMSAKDIAKAKGKPAEDIKKALAKGVKVEAEHTSDPSVAKEVARDHVVEFPNYYQALSEMEAKLKREAG